MPMKNFKNKYKIIPLLLFVLLLFVLLSIFTYKNNLSAQGQQESTQLDEENAQYQQEIPPSPAEEEEGKPFTEVVGYRDDLYGVECFNVDYIWVVGYWGAIFHSKTAGQTWRRQESGTEENLFGVSFVDKLNGWVVGDNGVILHTTNGGKEWKPQNSGTNQPLFTVQFIDQDHGWVSGAYGTILFTDNGGEQWQDKSIGEVKIVQETEKAMKKVNFYGLCCVKNDVWVLGEYGRIFHTTNSGKDWELQETGASKTLFGLFIQYFHDTWMGYAVGIDGLILHTRDKGATWYQQESGTDQNLFGITGGGDFAIAVGARGTVIKTCDWGDHWQKVGEVFSYQNLANVTFSMKIDQVSGVEFWIPGTHGELLTKVFTDCPWDKYRRSDTFW